MTLAGGFTSDRELRRSHTEIETANLNDLFPPPARPWIDGPAFHRCTPGGEPNSDDFLEDIQRGHTMRRLSLDHAH